MSEEKIKCVTKIGCGEEKSRDEFYKDISRPHGIKQPCRECLRVANSRNYGIRREAALAKRQAFNLKMLKYR